MTTLARVRGGRTGVRFISLEDWKKERQAAKGRFPEAKSRRMDRMESKLKKRVQRKRKTK